MIATSSSWRSRRQFLAKAGASAFGFMIVPRHVLGGAGFVPPSDQVNLAGVGAGGMGGGDITRHAKNGGNIVALCDVDEVRSAEIFKAFPKAHRYKDFRKMIEKEGKQLMPSPSARRTTFTRSQPWPQFVLANMCTARNPSPTPFMNAASLPRQPEWQESRRKWGTRGTQQKGRG